MTVSLPCPLFCPNPLITDFIGKSPALFSRVWYAPNVYCDIYRHLPRLAQSRPKQFDQGTSCLMPRLRKKFNFNAAINFCHKHPPAHPREFAPKICCHPAAFASSFCSGGGDLLGQLPRGGHLSINDVCHIWNFHYNGKNWRPTTLGGFTCCSEIFYMFKENYSILD